MKHYAIAITLIALIVGGMVNDTDAQVYPADFGQVLVTNGISNPTVMAFAPDDRVFVAQQNGSLRVIKNGTLLAAPFVTLPVNSSGERGLIGIALDPDFATSNFLYLYYTVPGSPAHNRISRFTANGDIAQVGSEVVVLELDPLSSATNHNGGAMHFGKDGKLYVAIGENANSVNAQNLDTYHGKLLRINKDGSVPDGNPFISGSEQRKRVWAYGLRNPYTFAIHPETGRILLNDVGQVTWEEVNDATIGGQNFGWPTTEGTFNQNTYPGFTNPIYAYAHGSGDGKGCAITGGTFFSPIESNYPSQYAGKYFIQDLCNSWINAIDVSGNPGIRSPFATAVAGNGLSITLGNDGNLYYLSRSTGALYKIIYNQTTVPYITNQPTAVTVAERQAAHLSVSALGSTPLSYQWQKDMVDVPGATGSSLIVNNASFADTGMYRVIVSNAVGEAISTEVPLSVVINEIPVAEINTPLVGSTYAAGTTIDFEGIGKDVEDGMLLQQAMHWAINFHHDQHQHDQPPIEGVFGGSFMVPNEGETSENVWYRIILTVTDLNGFSGKDSVDVNPRKSTLYFATSPPGLQITLDGQPLETPDSVVSVEGMLRTIGTETPQVKNGFINTFESWSNGGAITQVLATPPEDLTLTAQFSMVVGTEVSAAGEGFSVFPNPALQDLVTVRIGSSTKQVVKIRLVDLLSRTIYSHQQQLDVGDNDISLNLSTVVGGLYFLVVEEQDKTFGQRFLVSR